MPDKACCNARLGRILLASAAVAALAACGSLDGASRRVASVVTPYKIDIVQGNFVSREQVQALQPGMSRQQVRELLGTPLMTSLFHADRWEYVFTIKRPSAEMESRKLTVFFQGDALARHEGDEMPSETEFVATLGSHKGKPKVPTLEATEAQLARYPARKAEAAPAAPQAAAAATPSDPLPTRYPPLESSAR